MKYIKRIGADDISVATAGGKAFNLHRLVNAGFNVAPAYVLTSDAFSDFLKDNDFRNDMVRHSFPEKAAQEHSDYIRQVVMKGTLSNVLSGEVESLLAADADCASWAIRSSSINEDKEGASFAGLYDTCLNISGLQGVYEAIKRCWASYYNARAILYRQSKGFDAVMPHMAVILQHMINPVWAGVTFTRSPSNRHSGYLEIEYCNGCADALVSGSITPSSCRVDRLTLAIGYHRIRQAEMAEECLSKLGNLALQIENIFKEPQDIEWAYDGSLFWMLQSRPITGSCGNTDPDGGNEWWTRANIGEVLPGVVTEYTWEIFKVTLLGIPLDKLECIDEKTLPVRRFNGRVYVSLRLFFDSFCYLPTVTPQTMETVLGLPLKREMVRKYHPPYDVKVFVARLLYFFDLARVFPRLAIKKYRLLRSGGPALMSFDRLLQWTTRIFLLHRKCTAYSVAAFSIVSYLFKKWHLAEKDNLLPRVLIAGGMMQSADQGIGLFVIAEYIRKNPVLFDAVCSGKDYASNGDQFKSIPGGAEFISMFTAFLQENGTRAAEEFELSIPRWSEDPSFLYSMLRSYLLSGMHRTADDYRQHRDSTHTVINELRSRLPLVKFMVLKIVLKAYGRYVTMRENVKFQLITGYSELRRRALADGEKLRDLGIVNRCEDVFFLSPHEVRRILDGAWRSGTAPSESIEKRRRLHKRWNSLPFPDMIGNYEQLPATEYVNVFTGISCSPGIVEGRARVVLSIEQASELKADEILVTHHTDPGWTPLFLACKAVVTEIGGFLSHGATIAREYGVPAVAGVHDIIRHVKTGDVLRVDANAGTVMLVEKRPA